MEISTDIKTHCIRFTGRLDINSSNDLDRSIIDLINEEGDIILDLSGCSYLSSTGIRILLKTCKQLGARGDMLIIAGVVPDVMHVLEIASLTRTLHLETTVEAALAVVDTRRKIKIATNEVTLFDHQLIYFPTREEALTGTYCNAIEVLSHHELGFAIGFGSFSESTPSVAWYSDFFATLESCAGFISGHYQDEPDFRIISDPANTGLPVYEALSFGHQPTGSLQAATAGTFTLNTLSQAVQELQETGFNGHSIVLAVVIDQDAGNSTVSMVLTINAALSELVESTGLQRFREMLAKSGADSPVGITYCLEELEPITPGESLSELLQRLLTFENIREVEPVHPDAVLTNPLAWLFQASRFVDGRTRRLLIELSPGTLFESPLPFLARILYKDSSRLFIDPLHGGYAAQTYHVTSFDQEGRKMRPTVMKVAHRDLISRESERCQKFALPYIFNNCAVVLGSACHGETMAIRYNFVGIGGEASELKWLTHLYQEKEMDFLEPVFEKIFLHILKPWYGQPVAKTIYPFMDHDPTLTFFPHIYKTVSDLFSITPDKEQISVAEMERPLLNPYWFLKHEYPRHREWGMEYLTGICHGDLNMQNILLDESMNVYLIDFSETRPRSIISDFARLEAIFLVDNAPVEDETDMSDYLNFVNRFYQANHLTEIPHYTYTGRHRKKVEKNVALAKKMRQFALHSSNGNPDPLPYYMALLEWVLPVVCYTVPLPVKRLALIVSSLIAEKVLERMTGYG